MHAKLLRRVNDATAMNVTDVGNPQSKINGGDIGDRGIGT
jgi:hypothetical protein